MSERTHVFVDGFTDFTAQERRVLEALLLKGVRLTVCLGCDEAARRKRGICAQPHNSLSAFEIAADNGIKAQTERRDGESTKAKPLSGECENMFSYRAVRGRRRARPHQNNKAQPTYKRRVRVCCRRGSVARARHGLPLARYRRVRQGL